MVQNLFVQGIVKVGAVNADEHKSLGGRFGVRGFPTIKIFGSNKNKPEDYNGARTAQGIVDNALSALKSKAYAQLGGKAGGGGSSSKVTTTGLSLANIGFILYAVNIIF